MAAALAQPSSAAWPWSPYQTCRLAASLPPSGCKLVKTDQPREPEDLKKKQMKPMHPMKDEQICLLGAVFISSEGPGKPMKTYEISCLLGLPTC